MPDNGKIQRNPLIVFKVVAVAIVILLLALIAVAKIAKFRSVQDAIYCNNNQKQIGLSFRVFADGHSEKYPMNYSTNQGGTMEYTAAGQVFRHFLALSNELSTPLVLTCPSDTRRPVKGVIGSQMPTTNFAGLSDSNISYFVSLDTTVTNQQSILSGDRDWLVNGAPVGAGIVVLVGTNSVVAWSGAIHKRGGNICLGDGSVQSGSSVRLQEQVLYSDVATNRLLFP